jgi:hypothetical protein
MMIANLAFGRLSADDQAKLTAALEKHPHFGEYLSADRPDGVTVGEWAAMRAGVWPDWIRPPRRFEGDLAAHPVHRFHRGPWHYVNFAYDSRANDAAMPGEPLAAPTDILRQLALCRRFSAATKEVDPDGEAGLTAEQNRAVRICWLVHLVGDLHQPLHAASLVDERRLPGPDHHDQGGNLLAVRVEIGSLPTRLHGFWDQLPGTDNDPTTIVRLADDLRRDPLLHVERLPELQAGIDIRAWADESYALARKHAYLDGDLPTAVWDEMRGPLPATDDVPILPVGYERAAREIARRRIVVAGQRLAELLKEVLSTEY